MDLLPAEARDVRCRRIIDELQWQGPVFEVSAIKGEGTRQLCLQVMEYLDAQRLPSSNE